MKTLLLISVLTLFAPHRGGSHPTHEPTTDAPTTYYPWSTEPSTESTECPPCHCGPPAPTAPPGFPPMFPTNNCTDDCDDGACGEWSEWSPCSVSCDFGLRIRTRLCSETISCMPEFCNGAGIPPGGYYSTTEGYTGTGSTAADVTDLDVTGTTEQGVPTPPRPPPGLPSMFVTNDCLDDCPPGTCDSWTEWTCCSVTCDFGTRERTRQCSQTISCMPGFCNGASVPPQGYYVGNTVMPGNSGSDSDHDGDTDSSGSKHSSSGSKSRGSDSGSDEDSDGDTDSSGSKGTSGSHSD